MEPWKLIYVHVKTCFHMINMLESDGMSSVHHRYMAVYSESQCKLFINTKLSGSPGLPISEPILNCLSIWINSLWLVEGYMHQ